MSSTRSTTSSKRGQGYSFQEISSLLDVLEVVLPIGHDEWETVQREHLLKFPEQDRDTNSLRRKYNQLYRKRVPTGDPNCPPEVRRAKRICHNIKEKADCDLFDEDFLPQPACTALPEPHWAFLTSQSDPC